LTLTARHGFEGVIVKFVEFKKKISITGCHR